MRSSVDFFSQYHFEEEFLERIVTGDETWVAYVNPETRFSQCNIPILPASQRKPVKLVSEEGHGYSFLGC